MAGYQEPNPPVVGAEERKAGYGAQHDSDGRAARFYTLLVTFGLADRLITDATPEKVIQVLNTPIDRERVNDILELERQHGINYLKENLKDK